MAPIGFRQGEKKKPLPLCSRAGDGAEAAAGGRLLDLQRENALLHERLRDSKQLNSSLRSELDLRLSVMAHRQERDSPTRAPKPDENVVLAANASAEARTVTSGSRGPIDYFVRCTCSCCLLLAVL